MDIEGFSLLFEPYTGVSDSYKMLGMNW